jgi:hypothetical protein
MVLFKVYILYKNYGIRHKVKKRSFYSKMSVSIKVYKKRKKKGIISNLI